METTDQYLLRIQTQKSSTKYYQTEPGNIKRIICHDQVGFIAGMLSWFNIGKSITLLIEKAQKTHDHLNKCRKKPLTKSKLFYEKKTPNQEQKGTYRN